KTNVKAYSVIILACIVVAAILSFVMERFPIFVDQLEESIIEDMARQLDTTASPDAPVKLRPPLADKVDLVDRKQIEQLKKTYSETGKLPDQDRQRIEELKRKYKNNMDPSELEKLKKKYQQSKKSDSNR
ncbi:MAG: hypothetical protein JRG79_08515, partial [Deltaproteobacteria bacterium]|nr:hypothetical protein [Deltaproteobacteria bacterium]